MNGQRRRFKCGRCERRFVLLCHLVRHRTVQHPGRYKPSEGALAGRKRRAKARRLAA